jgi:hypothetical protein
VLVRSLLRWFFLESGCALTWKSGWPPKDVIDRLRDLSESGDYIGEHPAVGEAMPDGTVRTWRLRDGKHEVKS